ncbi:iron-sulfur cluster biosynthesis family protein [Lactobacillus alvi]|uniref:Iron-sulfur cluster biosynthesis family protein n=1 Tax=Limosilactobacillus alvi TaxID=990412 RepID=A0ABS2ES42_9LACO|nr:iron-sulfur cluster biosynthesis family protein [Limosilactobacillus alvi]MBM6754881.1 iron-sulfur cluster biosynthesis family protein [Limosilactobacillus alvi]
MQLTVTPAAKERLARYLKADQKLVLDFDDGVGPFSDLGNCSLDVNFKFIILDGSQPLPADFDAHFSSNLGEIYYKSYTKPQYAEKMKLDFEPTYFTMPLKSPLATLCDNVEVVDLTNQQFEHLERTTHDC